jgi:hypothetical protein
VGRCVLRREGGEDYITRSFMICTPRHYYSGDEIEKNEMGGACSMYGNRIGAYRVLVGRPEGKSPLGRSKRRRDYCNEMDV